MRVQLNNDQVFIYRIAGIAHHKGRILLHKSERSSIWALPGGACEFGELGANALQRELKEEIKAHIKVEELRFIVENLFSWESKAIHEIGHYYNFSFKGESKCFYNLDEFWGNEDHDELFGNHRLLYKWFTTSELEDLDLKPSFLKKSLVKSSNELEHIINNEITAS